MRPIIIVMFSLLITSCASTSKENVIEKVTDNYGFPVLLNPLSESVKQKFINQEYQDTWLSLLKAEGQHCQAIISDWNGFAPNEHTTKYDLSINNISVIKGSCVDGMVDGFSTIKFNFTFQNNAQNANSAGEIRTEGEVVFEGKFTNGMPNGHIKLYESSVEQSYSILQSGESLSTTARMNLLESFYVNGKPSKGTISLVGTYDSPNKKGVVDRSTGSFTLYEISHYKDGLINGKQISTTKYGRSTYYIKNGLMHGYSSLGSYSRPNIMLGNCWENGLVVIKEKDKCTK